MPADFRHRLLAGTAMAAVLAAAPAALAQTVVNQTVTNSNTVSNTGTQSLGAGTIGLGASVAINATGALTATSVTGLNAPLDSPAAGFGNITQKSTNTGASVSNTGTINIANTATNSLSAGASISIGATGSLNSVSVTAIAGATTKSFTSPTMGNVDQTATNSAAVSNTATPGLPSSKQVSLAGGGSSVSISASGAFASLGVTSINAINAGNSFTMSPIGNVDQTATNTGATVTNTSNATLVTGNQSGIGSSVSISASGATTATALTFINSKVVGSSVGNVTQSSSNAAAVANSGTAIDGSTINGIGSTMSVSAVGSVASAGISVLGGSSTAQLSLGDVTQTSQNTGATVSNTIPLVSAAGLTGDGASVSVSATGAVASVGLTGIVTGATITISGYSVGDVVQTSKNAADVTNTVSNKIAVTALSGDGATVSAGASGAVASVGLMHINGTLSPSTFGDITQSATNQTGASVTNTVATLQATNLSGEGTTASISANGAVASVGVTSITSKSFGATTLGPITQSSINVDGAIANTGTLLQAAKLDGIGASAVISAGGATASVSVTSINDTTFNAPIVGNIAQTATNGGTVTNSGAITLTSGASPLSGTGASASISAIGAGGFVSFTAMK